MTEAQGIMVDGVLPTSRKCLKAMSEFKDQYQYPKLKKPAATRNKRFEQFLWQELYDEYIRSNNRDMSQVPEKASTEYFDEYCKDVVPEDQNTTEELSNRYPLYSTTAITLWNHQGDITKDFKKRYSITRPVYCQTEQFG